MENRYYTNRHYADTDKIRKAVSRMNRDIRELSNHCDRLENDKEYFYKEIKKEIIKYGINSDNLDKKEAVNEILIIITRKYFDYCR